MNEEKFRNLKELFPKTDESQILQVSEAIESLLEMLGEDKSREGLEDTPYRFLKAFAEYGEGYQEDPKMHLMKQFEAESQDMIVVKDIPFESLCEHHLARFHGRVHIAYIPLEKIAGLSKFSRLVNGYSRRLQVQERLTKQVADAIFEVLKPEACAVIIEAEHACMTARGTKARGSFTQTYATRGADRDLLTYLK
ncbi:MAG: GTP cyclohydrolase I FolE [Streptococcaceae bacterium]|jgi:GTP cyclohydrolase I|nr:GTP cyclohydrolase I FolE [Streptococcaceae bacterium]